MTTPLEKQLVILNTLAELEESVGRLYEAYAALFPDYRQFWSDLVGEEKQHGVWVRELRDLVEIGKAKFSENRFNIFAIQAYINYLKEELEKATGRTLVNALSIASYIEESLMENKYFEIIDGDSEELRQTLRNLAGATQTHIERVRATLNTYKKKMQ
jgi:rubrerythrin